jgi:hypothetical protein
MRRLAFHLLVCAGLALPLPSLAGSALPAACAAPDPLTTTSGSLGQLASAIAAGGPVSILALGSATTVGSANASGEPTTVTQGASFPWHMLWALRATLPNIAFQLTVRGGRGMTAADMLVPLQAVLQEQHFSLVLWQTGTVEALRGMRLDGLRNALRTGTERVRQSGGDLVLIDSQYSRMLQANADLDPYEAALQQAATMPGVLLFHRFDLTRKWATDGQIDLERTPKADRDAALDELNTCLGQALARFVLSGAALQKK